MFGIDPEHAYFLKKVRTAIESDTTPEGVARAVHDVCRNYCKMAGMNADIETFCREERDGVWKVSFEAGPYEWAVAASLSHDNHGVLCEPYYSFDLECSVG